MKVSFGSGEGIVFLYSKILIFCFRRICACGIKPPSHVLLSNPIRQILGERLTRKSERTLRSAWKKVSLEKKVLLRMHLVSSALGEIDGEDDEYGEKKHAVE